MLFTVRDSALGVQLVRAVHGAMIGGQDHDPLVGEPRSVQLGEDRCDIVIRIAHSIQVVVVPQACGSQFEIFASKPKRFEGEQ
ncbi:hypothetical protein QTI66_32435 [Variovorax sp. J22R133]|uniref:hypothetical protein n=1 Tax=Variovorax brevis TaxID=3053503 RepID=UPI0025783AEF|nr:hypothetical protein [Variovorax sp. J22R133]MDM0116838.1 hypothetical protein [Variovorax sp. J22R133]